MVNRKLVEMLKVSFEKQYEKYGLLTPQHTAEDLIANGVTTDDKREAVGDRLSATGAAAREWISVKDRLPEERDTIFAKVFGADGRLPGMFLTTSDDVIAAVTYEDGTRLTKVMCTREGKWNLGYAPGAKEVTHWMPLPEPPEGVKE